jgi:F-type H+-transporting ATPase subunit delta
VTSVFSTGHRPLPVSAQRYAAALFALASEQKQIEAVEKDLLRLKAYLAGSKELRQFLYSPLLRRTLIAKALGAVLDKAETSKLTKNFFQVVAANGRARDIPTLLEAFFAILSERRGELHAEVTSAHALSDAQADSLKAAILKAFASAGARDVKLELQVDPLVLGGLRVQVGSYLFDGSLKGQLQKMEASLKNAA